MDPPGAARRRDRARPAGRAGGRGGRHGRAPPPDEDADEDAGPETQLWDPYGTGSFARPSADPYPTGGFTPAASYRAGRRAVLAGSGAGTGGRGHGRSRPGTSARTGCRAATSGSSVSRAEAPAGRGDRPRSTSRRPRTGSATGSGGPRRWCWTRRPFGTPVALKLELLQHTGSFKARGMLNRLLAAGPAGGQPGGRGLRWQRRPRRRVRGPRARAGRAHRGPGDRAAGEGGPATGARCRGGAGGRRLRRGVRGGRGVRGCGVGLPLVHAYDQPEVCAGNGTLALELIEQVGPVDTVLVATGGGGLVAGVAAALAGRARVVAVEPERCPTLHAALAAGEPGGRGGRRDRRGLARRRPGRRRSAGRSPRRPG